MAIGAESRPGARQIRLDALGRDDAQPLRGRARIRGGAARRNRVDPAQDARALGHQSLSAVGRARVARDQAANRPRLGGVDARFQNAVDRRSRRQHPRAIRQRQARPRHGRSRLGLAHVDQHLRIVGFAFGRRAAPDGLRRRRGPGRFVGDGLGVGLGLGGRGLFLPGLKGWRQGVVGKGFFVLVGDQLGLGARALSGRGKRGAQRKQRQKAARDGPSGLGAAASAQGRGLGGARQPALAHARPDSVFEVGARVVWAGRRGSVFLESPA